MAGGDADALLVVDRGLDEYFRNRLAVFGEIVIAERTRGIGVVEIDELPVRRFRRRGVVELELITPDRQEKLVVALLQGRGQLVEVDAERRRCFVDAGDRYWAALPGLRSFFCHDTLASSVALRKNSDAVVA